jgi:hypothetical protein
MVDEFQAFLLLVLTGLFLLIVSRVIREDLQQARRSRRSSTAPNRSKPPR